MPLRLSRAGHPRAALQSVDPPTLALGIVAAGCPLGMLIDDHRRGRHCDDGMECVRRSLLVAHDEKLDLLI